MPEQNRVCYQIARVDPGDTADGVPVCRAFTPEGAAEAIRAILACRDPNVHKLSVTVSVMVGPVEW